MKNPKLTICLSIILFSLAACNNYGKKLIFNEGELYYTENLTEEEATKLGNFLVDDGFFSGQEISIQIDKTNGTYIFRMVSKDGVEDDPNFITLAEEYTRRLSAEVFNNAPVDFHFCDTELKTKKEIRFTPAAPN
ncbi:MAG: hypothetical protein H7Y00_06170 [Fimbriimonadaceae bacterium]|nr:hypothetical protein [Chitinophagales bacterium]